jgi:UDP-N-acetylglucosamine/UDP-N-acetylgalactosamine diphosphorylase
LRLRSNRTVRKEEGMIRGRDEEESRMIAGLCDHGQEHIFRFWDQLSAEEKDRLISDLRYVRFDLLETAKRHMSGRSGVVRHVRAPEVITLPEGEEEMKRRREARAAGLEFISTSKAAIFTAAGGQSSRLGIDIPKGAFPVTPLRKKSLFQVFAEKIGYRQRRLGVRIPWIIMVSETNEAQTIDFFRDHGFFDLNGKDVRFIVQGMNPAIDREGRILMRERNRLFLNPNGHGGTFSALRESGAIPWLRERGVEEIFYFQVDNVLVDVLDPVFTGHHVQNRCDMSSKCVMKKNPGEKMGAFVREEGKIAIVEYTEIDSVVVEGDEDRDATLRAGNIAVHMISVDFVDRITDGGLHLPLHIAHKSIPCIDDRGKRAHAATPNGFKIETFIFDALGLAERTILMEVSRREEFSPLKNREGDDSVETVRRDQLVLFADWLEDAGVSVPRDGEGLPLHHLEISPLLAPTREDFLESFDGSLAVTGDTYLG